MDCCVVNASQKKRGRKKLLYQSIRNQMEFYFSPSNLSKDRWLSAKLSEDECIHLTEFLKFNKIKAFTSDVNDLAKAIEKSEILTVTEDFKVKRSQPIKFKENEEEYVIYVEQVPPEADHDWIKSIFSVFGKIDYISLPRFKNSNKCKGFAFIEFAEIESAHKAIQDFREKGNYLSTGIAPEELLSIANYEGNSNIPKKEKPDLEFSSGNEGEFVSDVLSSNLDNAGKRKKSGEIECDLVHKKIKLDNDSTMEEGSDDMNIKRNSSTEQNNNGDCDEIKKKKQRKKKNKKKKRHDDRESVPLQILSKRDWKRLRNKYLNMQKEKMKQLKKHLYIAQKKTDQNEKQRKLNEKASKKNEDVENIANKEAYNSTFTSGLIIKVKFDEPVVDVKGLKTDLKKNPSLKYVDVKEGVQKMYLRFDTPEAASEFCETSIWPNKKILKGQKESDYWKKLLKQRADKLCQVTKKKERGKDKLMKKAENVLRKHITFEE